VISTGVELAGFICLAVAAFIWQSVPLEVVTGLVTTGVLAVFVGYALDDAAAVVSLARAARPLRARLARRKAMREVRRRESAATDPGTARG